MKTIQMTIDDSLLNRVDRACDAAGLPRSVFIRQALEIALREIVIEQMEREQIEGYLRQPVVPGEFDVWEAEQSWGEA